MCVYVCACDNYKKFIRKTQLGNKKNKQDDNELNEFNVFLSLQKC